MAGKSSIPTKKTAFYGGFFDVFYYDLIKFPMISLRSSLYPVI